MKLEVGMYVRTDMGRIGRVLTDVYEYRDGHNQEIQFKDVVEDTWDMWEDIIKASHNIIDLIEVGDYVNGIKIDRVDKPCKLNPYGSLKYHQNEYCDYENILGSDIKSIVTKEQFESLSYTL